MIVTRFAPSPTGYLHIGGARTALFNWLLSRSTGGKFLLRIEDTDRARNVQEAIQPILDGMRWLGMDWDDEVVYQSQNRRRHMDVAIEMVERGIAYFDFTTPEEIDALKAKHVASGAKGPFRFHSPWRDREPMTVLEAQDHPHVIRFRAPQTGETVIDDLVQGRVTVQNRELDDLILMRSDCTPTYMLAVIVDDHDAGVNHVVRGDDHLSNAFRQLAMIRAMGWDEPTYAHLPLIYDETGKKLSKRHGAAGLEFYRDSGFLPDAVFNYLLRMGWGSGDHEILSRDDALRLFRIEAVGKAPARLDQKRLEHLNGVYIREAPQTEIAAALKALGLPDDPRVPALIALVVERSKTLVEAKSLIESVLNRPAEKVADPIVEDFVAGIAAVPFEPAALKSVAETIAEERQTKLKHVVAPLRLAITGSKISPPLFESMIVLGRDETLERLNFG